MNTKIFIAKIQYNGQVFLYGRNGDYQSCAHSSSDPAVSANVNGDTLIVNAKSGAVMAYGLCGVDPV